MTSPTPAISAAEGICASTMTPMTAPWSSAAHGLLLDLLASGDRAGVDDAMDLFIELSEPLLGD